MSSCLPASGLLKCLWERGGTLAADAFASQVIHKAMAFVAPKLESSRSSGVVALLCQGLRCQSKLPACGA